MREASWTISRRARTALSRSRRSPTSPRAFVRKIVTASRSSPARPDRARRLPSARRRRAYQAAVGDGRIVRVDSKTDTVIACQDGHCYRCCVAGQDLEDPPARKALPAPAPAAREAQPAPAPASRRVGPRALKRLAALALLCAACGSRRRRTRRPPGPGRRAGAGPRLLAVSISPQAGLELAEGAAGTALVCRSERRRRRRGPWSSRRTGAPPRATTIPIAGSSPGFGSMLSGGLALTSRGRFAAWDQGAEAGYRVRTGSRSIRPARRSARSERCAAPGRDHRRSDGGIHAGGVRGVLLGGKVRDFGAGERAADDRAGASGRRSGVIACGRSEALPAPGTIPPAISAFASEGRFRPS